MTLDEFQHTVHHWITTTGVRYFDPMTNMAVLTEEVGEVARVMARRYGEQSAKPGDCLDLADELADVLWVVAAIANQAGVNLTDAVGRNIEKKNKRDASRHQNNTKLTQNS